MAADDAGEKTEQPTPRRRSEALKSGQIPKSQDLSAGIALLGGALLLRSLGGDLFAAMLGITHDLERVGAPRAEDAGASLLRMALATAWMTTPFIVWLVIVTAIGGILQTGLLWIPERVGVKFDAIDPAKGLARLWSMEALQRTGMSLLKLAAVGWVAWSTILGDLGMVLAAAQLETRTLFDAACAVTSKLALRLGMVLLVLGLIDYLYQRWRIEQQLKMSKQEVRDELKNMEGDPQIKQRRRQVQMKLAMQRINAEVPKANVIVTNPTEFAVALRYDEATMAAPRVIAKGTDLLALRIRQLAAQHGVPVVRRPPLARALYAEVEVGREIPARFYKAVAEVLAYIHRLSRSA